MEVLTLTAPQTVSSYKIRSISFDWNGALIIIFVDDGFGKTFRFMYSGDTATAFMTALNKANLTTSSLQKRVLNQLVTDGFLPTGSVTGTPD